MAIGTVGVTDDHEDLAELARDFAKHARQADHDPRGETASYTQGTLPNSWSELIETGLHSVHIPHEYGGGGAEVMELVVVLEQLAAELYPGPLLATVTASALLSQMVESGEASSAVADALTQFSHGYTAAVIVDQKVHARVDGDSVSLDGEVGHISGALAAQGFLIGFEHAGTTRWALVPSQDVEVTPANGVDLTRDVGTVKIEVSIPESELLPALDREAARALQITLEGAEASGIAAAVTNAAVAHVKIRKQFRRALSSFQAIQQRLSLMHVHAEIARAVVWDMARSTPEERVIAASAGAISGLGVAIDNAFEYAMTLGAIGFTWEHEAHVYWRRSLQLGVLQGPRAVNEHRQGQVALEQRIRVDVAEPTDLPELRDELKEAIEEAGDPSDGVIEGSAWAPRRNSEWQRRLAQKQFVAPHLPAPYGRSADALTQAVIFDEFVQQNLNPPSLVIGDWVAPTIAEHGTQEQKDTFLPPTVDSSIIWCQLFSEPGAGSDLGSISTRAQRVNGGWRVSGQKIWNSMADVADWGALLVRTDPESNGSRGLAFMLVQMNSDGIEVRPIKQATGLSEFCEVFLDDVFVPDHHVIGEPGQGWAIATTTLSNERLRMGEELGHGGSGRFVELIANITSDDVLYQEAVTALGRAVAREYGLQALGARGAIKRMSGLDVSSETSVLKLANIIAQREGSQDLIRLSGPNELIEEQITMGQDHGILMDYLGLPAVLLGGGTPDIQLGVIAGRILGLR